jgi:hypothetical protein
MKIWIKNRKTLESPFFLSLINSIAFETTSIGSLQYLKGELSENNDSWIGLRENPFELETCPLTITVGMDFSASFCRTKELKASKLLCEKQATTGLPLIASRNL